MPTIYDLLKEEKEKVKKANELRVALVEEKRLRDLDESSLWFSIDFKSIGATSEKIKSAAVKQRLNEFPNTYGSKKAELDGLESDIKFIRETISVMKEFGVDIIDFSGKDKNKGASDKVSGSTNLSN